MILRFINRFRENYNKLLGYNNEYDAYNIDTFENILNKCVKRLYPILWIYQAVKIKWDSNNLYFIYLKNLVDWNCIMFQY